MAIAVGKLLNWNFNSFSTEFYGIKEDLELLLI